MMTNDQVPSPPFPVRAAMPQPLPQPNHDEIGALPRRGVLAAGLAGIAGVAAGAVGCAASSSASRGYVEPTPIYPPGHRPPAPVTAPPPNYAARAAAAPLPTPQPLRLSVVPRSAWTRAPVAGNVNAMNGVNRLTVHHAGGKAVWTTDAASTYKMLESIRGGHRSQGWADIGYHFIVDRDGRVLEGRPLRYQGAHVAENNEHNVGVMVLGNFDQQRPASRQFDSLNATLNALAAAFRVPANRVYTHRELKPTACPGASLQQHMDTIRRQAVLARG